MAAVLEYKCPCCGGAISFDTDAQKMKCPFCDTEFDVEAVKKSQENIGEDNINWNAEGEEWSDGNMRVYVCSSCGGEIITDEVTAASSCPYCDSPVIMKGNLSGALKPDFVIPFKLDKNTAVSKFKEHLMGKRLLPKVFKSESKINEIKGIYVPFWTYNADADASVSYKAMKSRTWFDSKYEYVEKSYYSVFRQGSIGFENIPVDASKKMADDLMDSIGPFDFSEAVSFTSAYLSGFFADKYDVEKEDCSERANIRIKNTAENTLRSTVSGYSTVVTEQSSTKISEGKINYALLPVWLLNVTWKNENYTFAMNGQTGKFVGNLPLDKKAYAKWFLFSAVIGSSVTALLLYIIQMFMS